MSDFPGFGKRHAGRCVVISSVDFPSIKLLELPLREEMRRAKLSSGNMHTVFFQSSQISRITLWLPHSFPIAQTFIRLPDVHSQVLTDPDETLPLLPVN